MIVKTIRQFIVFVLTVIIFEKMNAKEPEVDYCDCVAEVTSIFLNQVYKEYGFECGASGGRMPYDVEEISVQLIANRSATIDEARELEIILTEKFAQIINDHKKIRPFLREHPFPCSRARVSIAFEKANRKNSSKNDVVLVLHAKNRIYYHAKNPENPYVLKDIKDEPYEEAREIVYKNVAKRATKTKETF